MVAHRGLILDPLAEAGVDADAVTDVVFSHHHPDHTINAALFPHARFHDHWAIYRDDVWEARDADGYDLAPGIRLMRTPGHTAEDISTLVTTDTGLVVLTHLWWNADGPAEDPFATDAKALVSSRRKVLDLEPALIIPGHGASFTPGPATAV
jgi:glyoxylase-like metal-dependent hydrolase (beta-lactamase superfamily II)